MKKVKDMIQMENRNGFLQTYSLSLSLSLKLKWKWVSLSVERERDTYEFVW